MIGKLAAALVMRSLFGRIFGHESAWPGDAARMTFRSLDGSALEGALFAAARPRGVIVMCHPFAKSGLAYFFRTPIVAALTGAGWHVVLFNFKGFGKSEVGGINYGDDVIGVVREVKLRFPTLPLSLLGLSFGGFHAVSALPRLDDAVAAAFLDSVPLAPGDFFAGGAGKITRWLGRSRWAARTGTQPLGHVVQAVRQTRLQFVYGERVPYCEVDAPLALRQGVERRVAVLPARRHLEAFLDQPPGYLDLVLATFAEPAA